MKSKIKRDAMALKNVSLKDINITMNGIMHQPKRIIVRKRTTGWFFVGYESKDLFYLQAYSAEFNKEFWVISRSDYILDMLKGSTRQLHAFFNRLRDKGLRETNILTIHGDEIQLKNDRLIQLESDINKVKEQKKKLVDDLNWIRQESTKLFHQFKHLSELAKKAGEEET